METLKLDREFERVRRTGRSWACGPVVLNAAPNGQQITRCGFVAGKKVGGAVSRNRARRLMREAVRLKLPLLKQGYDLVWIARPSIIGAGLAAVQASVDEALRRGRLFASTEPVTTTPQSRIIRTEITDKPTDLGNDMARQETEDLGSKPERE